MKKTLLLLVIISFIVTGCSRVDADVSKEFSDGKEALEQGNYKEASTLLAQVLDKNGENDTARAMYIQAKNLMNAIKFKEDGNYKKAIKLLEEVENTDNGLSSAKRQASKLKKECTNLLEEYENDFKDRKENAKESIKKDKDRLEADAQKAEEQLRAEEEAQKAEVETQEQGKVEGESQDNINTETQPSVPPMSNAQPEDQNNTENIN